MNKTELYLEHLRQEGYRPELDKDKDIIFKHERITFVLFANEDDQPYFKLMIPFFWKLESAEETERAIRIMGQLNREYKAAKFCQTGDNVSLFAECFYEQPEQYKPMFPRYVDLLASAMREFQQLMREEAPKPPVAEA